MLNLWLLILIIPNLITCTLAFLYNPKQSVEQDVLSYRLPNNTLPVHYTIHLKTNLHEDDFSFSGTVEIRIVTLEETAEIIVHARQLTIGAVSLWTLSGAAIDINPIGYDTVTEFVTIRVLNGVLQSNQQFLLRIEYRGELREDNLGFYRSSYRDENNQLVYVRNQE